MSDKERRERGEKMIHDVYAGDVVVPRLYRHHAGAIVRRNMVARHLVHA
jgi:hypothetical protein